AKFGSDFLEGEANPLREDDERNPAQHCSWKAAMAGARSLGCDEAAVLVEPQRRGCDPAAPRYLADRQQRIHAGTAAQIPLDFKFTLTCRQEAPLCKRSSCRWKPTAISRGFAWPSPGEHRAWDWHSSGGSRARALALPSSPVAAPRSSASPRKRALTALSATSGARTISTKSPCRLPAISVVLMFSSTTRQISVPHRLRLSATRSAKIWSKRWRSTCWACSDDQGPGRRARRRRSQRGRRTRDQHF